MISSLSAAARREIPLRARTRRIAHARGKVLGGTSSINGMIFIRGNAMDYRCSGRMDLSASVGRKTETPQPSNAQIAGKSQRAEDMRNFVPVFRREYNVAVDRAAI